MRVLMVYHAKYPHLGGLSTHMTLIGKGLRELGHSVDYLTYSSLPRPLRIMFIIGPERVLNRLNKGLGTAISLYLSVLIFSLVLSMGRYRGKYDIIDAHHIASAKASSDAVRKSSTPVIQTVHTYYTFEMLSSGKLTKNSLPAHLAKRLELSSYRSSSHILAVDSRLARYVSSLGIPETKIDVMFNPVDTETFNPDLTREESRRQFSLPATATVVLCPRRLVKKNGVVFAALAAMRLRNALPNLMLVYAGEGDEESRIRELVVKHDLDKIVVLLGSVDHSDMHALYRAADLVVIPSIHSEGMEEATSISALEAMASGVPVIASDVGGLTDLIVDGQTGILVREQDDAALAAAIIELLRDKVRYEQISRNAANQVVERFSYISRAKFLLDIASKLQP